MARAVCSSAPLSLEAPFLRTCRLGFGVGLCVKFRRFYFHEAEFRLIVSPPGPRLFDTTGEAVSGWWWEDIELKNIIFSHSF
jgi:hypothetical protein